MEEDTDSRQRHLEREIACLKDTVWRLTSRVCVVESFLKNKYGHIVATPTLSLSQSEVKVIPIVIPDTVDEDEDDGSKLVVEDMECNSMVGSVVVTTITQEGDENLSVDSMQDTSATLLTSEFSGAFESNDFQQNQSTEENTLEEASGGEELNITLSTLVEPDMIRIYKPELKTFVTVKVDASQSSVSTNGDDLECHICQKKFSRQENVQRHMLLHRAAQFKCDECGRGFNHQGNLNTHKRRHERMNLRRIEVEEKMKRLQQKPQNDLENRKFPCSYCEKRFYTAQQRNIHTRIHTGEKPFECNLCGMRFNQKASLFDHSLGHVGEKNNYCHLCPAGFVRSRNLLKHIRQVHKMTQIKTILNGEKVVEFVPENEAADIIESRKGNVEAKKPPKPRAKKKKAKTSTKRATKNPRSEEEASLDAKDTDSELLSFVDKSELDDVGEFME